MSTSIDDVREGFARLREAGCLPNVSGVGSHRFRLNPVIEESVVAAFERSHGVTLPEGYRRFLTEIGNGGAGPFYGVSRLGEMDSINGEEPWKAGDGFIGVLSEPFPHREAWNDVPDYPECPDYPGDAEEDAAYDRTFEAADAIYWDSRNVNGAVPICHRGCCLRDWLVVTGPEAGHVWEDRRVDDEGLVPSAGPDGRRMTFLDWYCDWLGAAVARLR